MRGLPSVFIAKLQIRVVLSFDAEFLACCLFFESRDAALAVVIGCDFTCSLRSFCVENDLVQVSQLQVKVVFLCDF